jgi:hypothetical protein
VRRALVAALLSIAVTPQIARGGEPLPIDKKTEADRLVFEGKALGEAGRVDEAAARFRAAEALYPRALHDCNLGLAFSQARRWALAHLHLDRCRARSTEALPPWVEARQAKATEALRAAGYAPIEITVEPRGALVRASGVGAEEPFTAPQTVWLPAGPQEIVASADGHVEERRQIVVGAGGATAVAIVLRPVERRLPPASAVVAPTAAPVSAAVEVRARPAWRRPLWIAGATVGALGLALVAGGAGANVAANSTADDIVSRIDAMTLGTDEHAALYQRWTQRRDATIALYTVGAVAVAGGVALVVAARPRSGERVR